MNVLVRVIRYKAVVLASLFQSAIAIMKVKRFLGKGTYLIRNGFNLSPDYMGGLFSWLPPTIAYELRPESPT